MNIKLDQSEVYLLEQLVKYQIEQGATGYRLEGYQNILAKIKKEKNHEEKN